MALLSSVLVSMTEEGKEPLLKGIDQTVLSA